MSELIVLVTCKDNTEGKKIARQLVEEKLAACVNLIDIESVYRWMGKIKDCGECLLIIKTTEERFEPLRKKVREIHSYEVPEIVGIKIDLGDQDYLTWVRESTSG
jgi:periplasmic divalent cation tolerance protein